MQWAATHILRPVVARCLAGLLPYLSRSVWAVKEHALILNFFTKNNIFYSFCTRNSSSVYSKKNILFDEFLKNMYFYKEK